MHRSSLRFTSNQHPLPMFSPSFPPPTPPPDVHVLAAIAANVLSGSSGVSRHQRFYTPDKPRTLDAIAALCVSPELPHPVAVALTIDANIRQVRLLISHGGADHLDTRLLNHLRKTWGLLRTVSNIYSGRTRKVGHIEALVSLFRYGYHVHRVEFLRVVREWWPKLDAGHRTIGRRVRRCEPTEFQQIFMNMALAVRMAVRTMGDDLSLLTEKQWRQLLRFMGVASYHAKFLLQHWVKCMDWGMDFEGMYCNPWLHFIRQSHTIDTARRGPSIVRCALENLTSLHRHLDLLADFARSPRPIDIFSHSLHVSFLPLTPRLIPLPTDWKPTLLNLCSYIDGSIDDSIDKRCTAEATALSTSYSTPQHCAPHPECALIMHLHSQRGSQTPALGYIGLSEPPCAACALWMGNYRARGKQRYRHRGSSNAWRWPWAFAQGVSEQVFAEEVEKEVATCCRYNMSERGMFYRESSYIVCEMPAIGEPYWMRPHACLFGCYVGEGCRCFSLLWG